MLRCTELISVFFVNRIAYKGLVMNRLAALVTLVWAVGCSCGSDDSGDMEEMMVEACDPDAVCDVLSSNGCESTQSCNVVDDGGDVVSACVGLGSSQEGDRCDLSASNECAQGLQCHAGVCRTFCCINRSDADDTCPTDQFCLAQFPGVPIGVCIPADNCDLLDPVQSCLDLGYDADPVTSCYTVGRDDARDTHCFTAGNLAQGESCTDINECQPGFTCATPSTGGPSVCLEMCSDTMASPCPGGFTCVDVESFPDGIGVCEAT